MPIQATPRIVNEMETVIASCERLTAANTKARG